MKANFTLTMENEPQYHALANMPQEYNMTLGDDWLQTKFQMSVPMSTYLLCFVVSDFVMKSNVTKSGVVVSQSSSRLLSTIKCLFREYI